MTFTLRYRFRGGPSSWTVQGTGPDSGALLREHAPALARLPLRARYEALEVEVRGPAGLVATSTFWPDEPLTAAGEETLDDRTIDPDLGAVLGEEARRALEARLRPAEAPAIDFSAEPEMEDDEEARRGNLVDEDPADLLPIWAKKADEVTQANLDRIRQRWGAAALTTNSLMDVACRQISVAVQATVRWSGGQVGGLSSSDVVVVTADWDEAGQRRALQQTWPLLMVSSHPDMLVRGFVEDVLRDQARQRLNRTAAQASGPPPSVGRPGAP